MDTKQKDKHLMILRTETDEGKMMGFRIFVRKEDTRDKLKARIRYRLWQLEMKGVRIFGAMDIYIYNTPMKHYETVQEFWRKGVEVYVKVRDYKDKITKKDERDLEDHGYKEEEVCVRCHIIEPGRMNCGQCGRKTEIILI